MVNGFFVNHVEVLVKHLKYECVLCAKQYFARNVVVGIATNRVGSVILSLVVTGMQEK